MLGCHDSALREENPRGGLRICQSPFPFFTVAVSLLPRTVWAEVPGFARARVVAHCAPWPRGLRTAVQEKLKIQAGRKGPCALLLYSQEPADRNRATVRSTGAAVLQRLPPPTLVLGRDAQSACARGGARTRPPPARRTGAPIRAQASSLAPRRLVGRRPACAGSSERAL